MLQCFYLIKGYRNEKQKGFTLIELFIVVVIIGILVNVYIPLMPTEPSKKTQSIGSKNTPSNTQSDDCKHGYIIQPNGNQMLDENGKGIKCE